jgi:hypothetical protein
LTSGLRKRINQMTLHLQQSSFKNGEQTSGASPYNEKIGFDHEKKN